MKLSSEKTARNFRGFNSTDYLRRSVAILILATLVNLLLPSAGVFAAPRGASSATGIIRVAGTATVDGARAISWQTIFPGSHIATSEGSESIIDLGRFTRFLLSAETELTLDFSRVNISSSLSRGVVRGFIPAGIPVNIKTVGAELITDSSQPAAFIVQVDGDSTKVSVEKGRLEVRTGNSMQSVGVGQVFATASGSPTQPAPQNNLTTRQRVGLFAAIGAAAAILAFVIIGRDETAEPEFGGCVIILSGPSTGFCP